MSPEGSDVMQQQQLNESPDQHQDLQQQVSPDEADYDDGDMGPGDGDNYMDGGPEHKTASSALAEQRMSRKRTQEDVKLLANRIQLLKLEEKKVSQP